MIPSSRTQTNCPPHPYLLSASLFISNLPNHISEADVRSIFNKDDYPRTNVNFMGKRAPGLLRPRIDFPNIDAAEQALALLHLRPIPHTNTPVVVEFCVAKDLKPLSVPDPSVSPRLLKTLPTGFTERSLYDLLRPYGPLYSVRIEPDIGGLVQFWTEAHAKDAELNIAATQPNMEFDPYDPCSLFVSNIHFDLDTTILRNFFAKFGCISSTEILTDPKTGKSRGKAVVTFTLASEALNALHAMHGAKIEGRTLCVLYRSLRRGKKQRKRRGSIELEGDTLAEPADLKDVDESEVSASDTPHDTSELTGEALSREEAKTDPTNEQHFRQLYEAEVLHRLVAEAEAELLREELMRVNCALEMSERKLKILQPKFDGPVGPEARKSEPNEEAEREEERRAAAGKKLRQKMREFQEREDEHKRAAAEVKRREQLQREAEEKAWWEKVRREREAWEKEEREREEREKEEAERREREERWTVATEAEQLRCLERDLRVWSVGAWTPNRALQRLKLLMDEFDKTRFSEAQPLTFRAVPWPVLADPRHLNMERIHWEAVEAFFECVKHQMASDIGEFNSFVRKLHRAFHPDRWKARRILMTVMDEELRASLEAAGNVVAQAITPIWIQTKNCT